MRVRTYLELRPRDISPDHYQLGPVTRPRTLREGFFKWYWLADIPLDRVLLIGPFYTRHGAESAWAYIEEAHKYYAKRQDKVLQAFGGSKVADRHTLEIASRTDAQFAEDVFGYLAGSPQDRRDTDSRCGPAVRDRVDRPGIKGQDQSTVDRDR